MRGNGPAAADHHADVRSAFRLQPVHHVAEILVVAALVAADGDAVGVLLDRGPDDVRDAAVVAEVDDLRAVRLQDAADDVDRSVVSVEQRRRAHEAQRAARGGGCLVDPLGRAAHRMSPARRVDSLALHSAPGDAVIPGVLGGCGSGAAWIPDKDVCSTREAADRLGVSLRTVQLWSEAGLLRAWKTPGGHRRILTASIDELLKRRTVVGTRRAPGGNFQVLVVEDEPDFRQLFELHLRSWGLPIHLASVPSGFDALLQIGASQPDLLITDLRMPGIDGFEMLRALKASGAIGELEIIVVTALTEHTIAERGGLPAGVTVLYKPLHFAELRKRLDPMVAQWQRAAAG